MQQGHAYYTLTPNVMCPHETQNWLNTSSEKSKMLLCNNTKLTKSKFTKRSFCQNLTYFTGSDKNKLALRLQWPCNSGCGLSVNNFACGGAIVHLLYHAYKYMIALTFLYSTEVLGVWILLLMQIDKEQVCKSARLKKCKFAKVQNWKHVSLQYWTWKTRWNGPP